MRWIALQVLSIEPADSLAVGTPVISTAATQHAISAAAAQLAICAIALSFTPRVALCGNAVVLEVSGSLRLFGGLHKLAALLAASRERSHQHLPHPEPVPVPAVFDMSGILRKPLYALDRTASLEY